MPRKAISEIHSIHSNEEEKFTENEKSQHRSYIFLVETLRSNVIKIVTRSKA